ncbi:MAG: hypothetical protein A2W05_08780 [Candidatus Schekmanbacteria bacterium RBG_16_38_10]|uniref:Uncharacterized protein n=1 Tax=Candidatus Schekmanbacteria bacterium RBG_16_38_10 TaxID=1817879 RepID=A0A1F7RQ62_9BACT|nr:MAG: hypothetical protein A2W05_08780 [Candidatus Schekmanbacteria bacterium RBG_16_38_10]
MQHHPLFGVGRVVLLSHPKSLLPPIGRIFLMSAVETPKALGVKIKRVEFIVGDEVLELREPGITATHAVLEAVFDSDLFEAISKVSVLMQERELESKAELSVAVEDNLSAEVVSAIQKNGKMKFLKEKIPVFVEIAQKAVLPLLSRKAGLIAGIIFDTKENRDRLSLNSSDLRNHVSAELSPSQAVHFFVELKELIDWSDLTKKVMTLLPKKAEEARPAPTEQISA